MPETRMQFWHRRGAELTKLTKGTLCAQYRAMGGLGGVHPPEKWRKDEIVTSIVDIEWSRLPEADKLPDPPVFDPPCDECGQGPDAHPHGHPHNYHYTAGHTPEANWICRTCTAPQHQHTDTTCPTPEATSAPAVQLPPPAEFPPRCARPDCTGTPVDHVGWMLGHMFMAPQDQAEEQPPGADATARSLARQMTAYGAASAALAETIANPPQPTEEQPPGADATADRVTVVKCEDDDRNTCERTRGYTCGQWHAIGPGCEVIGARTREDAERIAREDA